VLLFLCLTVPATAQEATAEPDVVHIGILGFISDAPFYVAQAKGYFEQMNLKAEFTQFASGSDAIPALVSGQIDVTYTSYSAGMFNAIGRGIDMRFIVGAGNQDDRSSGYLVVSEALAAEMEANPDAGLSLLKGRTIAANALGNTAQAYYYWGLTDAGLTFDDVNVVILSFPDQLTALASGAIDAGIVVDPTTTIAALRGIGVKARSLADLYGAPHSTAGLAASAAFLEQRRDVAVRLAAAYLLGARDVRRAFVLREQPIRDEVLAILKQALPSIQDEDVLQNIFTDGGPANGEFDLPAAEHFLEAFRTIGLIEVDEVPLDNIVDPTIARDAVALIGPWDYSAEDAEATATPEAAA
jgi:NitT/TauT family transport system substrate-binding protein